MAVNLSAPQSEALLPVAGVRIGVTAAGIRKADRADLTLIKLAEGSKVAGVFTRNQAAAAPVLLCRDHVRDGEAVRALVINTGVANAGTGETGLRHAQATCEAAAELLGIMPRQVLPFSTGVILEELPLERIVSALPAAQGRLRDSAWLEAAHAIMTTDTVAKAASRTITIDGHTVTLTGMSKGAGMIRPDMATMLGFIACDACISQPLLERLVRDAADESFNSISVEGDTSTNDSFVLIATGQAGHDEITADDTDAYRQLRAGVVALAIELAQAIVRDGEGATKFITVRVEEGANRAECRSVAYAIAHSPLVKTAFFASDPNLGRIVCAIGNADIPQLDMAGVHVWLGSGDESVQVVEQGGRATGYTEAAGERIMAASEIVVRVALGRGAAAATVWTCDLSHEYVRINAEYRS